MNVKNIYRESVGYIDFRNCFRTYQTLEEYKCFLRERNESMRKRRYYEKMQRRKEIKEKFIEYAIGVMLVSAYFCLMILNPRAASMSIPMSMPVVFVVLRVLTRGR